MCKASVTVVVVIVGGVVAVAVEAVAVAVDVAVEAVTVAVDVAVEAVVVDCCCTHCTYSSAWVGGGGG